MANSSQISKFIKNLLAPGEYAKAAKKTVTETDAERLARLAKTQPIVDKATAAQDRIKLRELLETRVKENPTPENIRILEKFNEDFYGVAPSKVTEEASTSKIIPSKRKPLKEKELDSFQETLETRVRENPTPDNIEVLDNFRKKREAGEYPDLSQALKVAGLTGAIGLGTSLVSEDAAASPITTAKKAALELFHATRGAFEGDKLKAGSDKLIHFGSKEQAASRFDELLKQNKVSSGAQTIPVLADIKNPVELSDLNDWSANKIFRDMKKRGIINEQQAQEIVDKSRATGKQWGNDIDKDTLFDYMQNKLGYDAIKYKNIFEASEADKILAASKINPEMAKIPDLRAQKASLEAQLLDETGNIKPSGRETDKIHDQINKLDKQLRPLQNKLQSTFEQGAEYSYAVPEKHGGILKSKFSGTPLAIGGTAIGAGALASSSSAQAATDGSILQSNPEFSSSKSSAVVKKAVSEEQEKSKLLKALESYGTGARSAVSSATLGISEPIVSGLSAAVGSLIEAGFDAKDAVEFIKKASEVERFKKNYEEDVAYRKKMQEEHPIADISGSLVGAFSPVGPAAGVTKLTEKAVRSAIPAIKTAQEAKGLKAAATRIGGNVLEGAISTPIVTGAENITKGLVGNKEEFNSLEDSLMGGTFGGVLGGAVEAGKAIGGRKVAGALGALGLAAGLSSDNAKAKEQAVSDLTENEKNELRWRSIMRQINKSSSSL